VDFTTNIAESDFRYTQPFVGTVAATMAVAVSYRINRQLSTGGFFLH
jgi:hypothetical protein